MSFTVSRHPHDRARYSRELIVTPAARVGFELLLETEWTAERGRILLPAYIGLSPVEGSGVFDPIGKVGATYAFYGLHGDLTVDLRSLEGALSEGPTFAVFLIHYFGFPQPALLAIRELCDAHGVLLIEDCAHCLLGLEQELPVAEVGDYALFSFHKVLGCDRGGALQLGGARDPERFAGCRHSLDVETLAVVAGARVDRIREHRRAAYQAIADQVVGLSGVRLLHPTLPAGVAPLNLPVLIEGRDRFEVYKAMRAAGVGVIACYHTLIPPISAEGWPVSHRIARTILNLPIHQDVLPEHHGLVVHALGAALR